MTSIFGQTIVPKAGVEEALPVWMKIDWRPEIEKGIYIDWGKYYSRRGRVNHALTYLNKASELAPEEVMILYNRSKNLRRIGKSHSALQNCKTARKILKSSLGPQSYPINLETCDALYELNRFEDAKAEAHNSANLFSSNKTQAFEDRLLVIDENIRDCCGDGLTPFILKNQNIITHVQDLENNKMKIDERPLWKILKEEGKCDVLSIPEIKSQQLSPREIARRRRAYDICNQYYLDKSWKDVLFLEKLRTNPNVLMPQCRNSHKFLETLIKQQYKIVQKFAKMIHSRSPMYYMRYNKHADKTLSDKFMEDQLSRIQYQTRRNMVSVLRTIRRLREEQNISKLSKYVEEVMGEYVVLKTFRIMPWKFEFINEVYNTLALALAEQYYVPSNFKFNERKAFHHLLHLETDKIKDTPQFVFGDRSTYQDITAMDLSGIKSRRQISNLENRMIFAKYSIEKCYLLHQIANIHLDSNRYEECGFTARKAIEESKNCNSLLWSFLCTILIVKSNASLNKFERAKEALKNAMQIATDLDCHNLAEFVEMSFSCLERISIKGSLSNPSSHRGSKSSVGSTNSM
ncbi:hypothetical protein KR215_003905 [Drosophila sulfurigaster]|nr:hypothetical protein KR215_003905 [Drosophila sulfurigaster]